MDRKEKLKDAKSCQDRAVFYASVEKGLRNLHENFEADQIAAKKRYYYNRAIENGANEDELAKQIEQVKAI